MPIFYFGGVPHISVQSLKGGHLPMASISHVIYASVATEKFGVEQLTDLLQKSRDANKRLGLTGILLFSNPNFFQVLEGEPADLDHLYGKILLDKRHAQITLIIREPIQR